MNFLTTGVYDLKRSKAFFAELFGWRPIKKDSDNMAFFDMGGRILSLFPWSNLGADIGMKAQSSGF